MRPIKEGDTVTVCMARGGQIAVDTATVLDYPQINRVTVLHAPVDIGDLWYFRTGTLEFAVNPCASDFVGLILEGGAVDGTLRHHHLYAPPSAPPPSPTRWMDWPGRHAVRIIGGDGD